MQGKRRPRRAGRGTRLVAILALVSGTLVAAGPTAHALTSCGAGCPVFADEDNYTVAYGLTGTTLTVDAAHGLLANDEGPSTTKVDLLDTVDDFSTDPHSLTTDQGFTVTINGNGSFTYTADDSFSGLDSFSYTAWDSAPGHHDNSDFNQANITIVPIVLNATYYTRGSSLDVSAPGALVNSAGVDSTSLILDSTSAHGADVSDNGDGAFTYTAAPGYQGHDTFGFDVSDIDFDNDYQASVNVFVDSTKPSVAMSSPTSSVSLSPDIPLHWSASDGTGGSGIAHYDVQRNTGAWNGVFQGWTSWKTNTAATSATYPGSYGHSYCFRTRAVDRAGNASGWSMRCTSVPLKAGSLSYSSGWTTNTSSSFFGGYARLTRTALAHATLKNVVAQHIWLVVTKCATCGTVQVRWNGAVKASVNLASSSSTHRQLVLALSLPSAQRGTLSLYNVNANRALVLEGVDAFLH